MIPMLGGETRRCRLLRGSILFLSLVLVNLDLIFDEMVFSLELHCVDCVEFSDVLVLRLYMVKTS